MNCDRQRLFEFTMRATLTESQGEDGMICGVLALFRPEIESGTVDINALLPMGGEKKASIVDLAISWGWPRLLELAISLGGKIEPEKANPKHLVESQAYKCMDVLARHGFDMAPGLLCAAELSYAQGIRHLLGMGMDPNMKDVRGRTPLHHLAAGVPNPEAVEILLVAGADPRIPNCANRSALDVCRDIEIHEMLRAGAAELQMREVAAESSRARAASLGGPGL